jgi:phosphate transport system substrate-binding protein
MARPRSDGDSSIVSRRNVLGAAGSAAALSVAGCLGSGDEGDGLSGEIIITGSSTVYPISNALAEEFKKDHPDVTMSVDPTGSGGGFENHFCPGNSDINGASRPIKDSEVQHCQENDVEPIEFEVGGDALTVAVNNENDWVDCVTEEELKQIWQPGGAQMWSDVRDEWPDEPFELYGPASTSGTFDWFTENIIGEAGSHRDDYEASEDDNRLIQGIKGSKYAMGYFGYAYYKENKDAIKGLEIDGGSGCTPPSLANAKDGSYPLARPLFIYPAKGSLEKEQVREFLRFYLEQAETDIVSEIGYVPTSEQLRDDNLDKLESAIEDVQ